MKALALLLLLSAGPLSAAVTVVSPDHGQTFAFGSERHREWLARGADRHLAIALHFTNDPYVDRDNPRQYDDFVFNFPNVRLGADGRTFFARDGHGGHTAVAERKRDFLGIEEIRLLPTSELLIDQRHGYLTLVVIAGQRGIAQE